jgi:predicted transcriptional regulator
MNWLKPVSDQSTQTDKRIAISCMGRGISSTIVAELTDNKWISHGDGEEAIRAEKISELEDNLQGRQGDVYDRLIQAWESNTKMSTVDIANALNLTANKALRTLKALERKGLIVQDGVAPRTNEKGRPIALFRPTKGDTFNGCFNDFNDFNTNKTPKNIKTPVFSPPLREQVPINLPVQRLVDNGDWQNGWIISDNSDLSNIQIARVGSPHICIDNCKWLIDLRPCKNN